MQAHQVIRDRLRQELDRHSLTAVQLARNAGVKTSFIYDILNGKSTNPSTVKLAMVAETLGINLAYLAGSAESPTTQAGAGPSSTDIAAIPQLAAGGRVLQAAYVYFQRSWIADYLGANPDHLRAVSLAGESMEPTLRDHDLLLVDTSRTSPSPPGIFVLSDGFGLVARRLEYTGPTKPPRVHVMAGSPESGAYERPLSEIKIIGRVIWFARQM